MFLAADYDAIHGTAPRPLGALLPTTIANNNNNDSNKSTSSTVLAPVPPNTEAEKIRLPVPAPHHVSIERVREDEEGGRDALRIEMDHETFEGRGRTGSVVSPGEGGRTTA